jgi:hypothetical protein
MIAVVVLKKWAKLRRQPPATRRDVMDTSLDRLVVITGVSDHPQTVRKSEICPRHQEGPSSNLPKDRGIVDNRGVTQGRKEN